MGISLGSTTFLEAALRANEKLSLPRKRSRWRIATPAQPETKKRVSAPKLKPASLLDPRAGLEPAT